MGMFDTPARLTWLQLCKKLMVKEYRNDYIKLKKRALKMYWKYDSHVAIEKFGAVGLGLTCVYLFANWKLMAKILRLPTEDVNELLKHDVWLDEKNELDRRKDQASKMLMDSNYIQKRNAPIEN